MSTLLLAAALAVPLAAPTTVVELGARTEGRFRKPGDLDAEQQLREHSWDFDVSARLGAGLVWRRAALGVAYSPRASWNNLNDEPTTDLVHNGELAGSVRWERVQLSALQLLAYGRRTSSLLTGPGLQGGAQPVLPPTQSVQPQTVHYALSDTSLVSELELSRRSDLELSVGYRIEGGTDEESRQAQPLNRTLRGLGEWTYRLTRLDSLVPSVGVVHVRTDNEITDDLETTVLGEQVAWQRRWSTRTTSEIAAGAAQVLSESSDEDQKLYPAGSASLSHVLLADREAGTLDFGVTVSSSVVVDQFSGLPDQRGQVAFRSSFVKDPIFVNVIANHVESFDRTRVNALRMTSGEASVRYQFSNPLAVESGFRAFQQNVTLAENATLNLAPTGLQWAVFLALVFRISDPPDGANPRRAGAGGSPEAVDAQTDSSRSGGSSGAPTEEVAP